MVGVWLFFNISNYFWFYVLMFEILYNDNFCCENVIEILEDKGRFVKVVENRGKS